MINSNIHENIKDYISEQLFDPWINSPFYGYRFLGNKQKGELGERIISMIFENKNHKIERAETATAGYDRIIDGIKTEIKFSLAHTDIKKRKIRADVFTMNHVAEKKDWERLIFLGINPDEKNIRSVYVTKENFSKCLKTNLYFSKQQGGKNSANDDYMIAGKKLIEFIESPFVNHISEW